MGRVETNFKQTEVGLIPEDWEVRRIDEIANVIGGGTPSTFVSKYWNGEINWFTPTEIGGQKYVIESQRKITSDGLSSCSSKILPKGTILLTTRAAIGDVSILLKESSTNQGFQSIVVKNGYDNEFIYYVFLTLKPILLQRSSGSTFLEISPKKIKEIGIIIPNNKTEQTLIANALSDADGYIESLEKLIAKKQKIKQGAMQQLLSLKPHWEVSRLGKIAEITRGASPRPIDDPKWFDDSSLVGWVRISDVTSSIKTLKVTTQKLSDLGIKSSRYVERGNLIMSICATIGRPILTEIDVCIHDGFVVFGRPEIDKEYLYYFLSFIEKDWSKNGQTGSQMNLNTNIINLTEIHFPKNKIEQEKIAKTFSDMDLEIATLNKKLTKAKNLKQGMMQQLLTGKIRLV